MKTKTRSSLLYGSVAIALVLTPAIGFAIKEKLSSEAALTNYASAIEKGKFRDAYDLTDPDFQTVTPFETFVDQHKQLESKLGKLVSITLEHGGVEYSGFSGYWNASVLSRLTYSNGRALLLYNLRKEEGRWLVRGYKRIE